MSLGAAAVAAALGPFPERVLGENCRFQTEASSTAEPRFESFVEQVNTTFEVVDDLVGRRELRLIEVTPYVPRTAPDPSAPDADYEKFSLLFAAPRHRLLTARIHKFSHRRLGRFEMFITPVLSMSQERYHYEAVFNRPVPA